MHTFSTNTLLSIVGPTGSGKSDLAVALALTLTRKLAEATGTFAATGQTVPIVSTDSRQVYKGMAIGTAQPVDSQRLSVPHHFIADREPTERFTCADFEREALELLQRLFAQTPIVVAVGGSGLYVEALTRGLDELPEVDMTIRKELTDTVLRAGTEPLLHELAEKDPLYFEQVDKRNPARVQRALEVIRQTGCPFSEFRKNDRKARSEEGHEAGGVASEDGFEARPEGFERPFRTLTIVLDPPREELYRRIDSRVDRMLASGLEAEARALKKYSQLPALQTVGYRELNLYFTNEITLERAVELIKRNSRRYAKRQLTWFRHRNPEAATINKFGDDPAALTESLGWLTAMR